MLIWFSTKMDINIVFAKMSHSHTMFFFKADSTSSLVKYTSTLKKNVN